MGVERRAPLGFGYIAALLILIAGALYVIMLDPAAQKIIAISNNQSASPAAQTHVDYITAVWNNLPYVIMFVALVYIVARAYFESEVQ